MTGSENTNKTLAEEIWNACLFEWHSDSDKNGLHEVDWRISLYALNSRPYLTAHSNFNKARNLFDRLSLKI